MNTNLILYILIALSVLIHSCKSEEFPVANFKIVNPDCLDSCVIQLQNTSLFSDRYFWIIDSDTIRTKDASIDVLEERVYAVELHAFNALGEVDIKKQNIDFKYSKLKVLSATLSEVPIVSTDGLGFPDVYVRIIRSDNSIIVESEVLNEVKLIDLPKKLIFNNALLRSGTYKVQILDKDETSSDLLYEFEGIKITKDTREIRLSNNIARTTLSIYLNK